MTTKTENPAFSMCTLTDLPGFPGELRAAHVSSLEEAVAALRAGLPAATSAGCDGALNVWVEKDGYRCETYAYGSTKASDHAADLDAVAAWLDEHWADLGDRDRMADLFGG